MSWSAWWGGGVTARVQNPVKFTTANLGCWGICLVVLGVRSQPLRQGIQNLSPRPRPDRSQRCQRKRKQSRGGVSVRVNFERRQEDWSATTSHGAAVAPVLCKAQSLDCPSRTLPRCQPPPLVPAILGGAQQALDHWELAFCSTVQGLP